jgi:hypothetical protein
MPFYIEDSQAESLLEKILNILNSINSNLEKIMSTPPVTQAAFDTALSTLNSTLTQLLAVGQQIGVGLTNLETALQAAQQNPGQIDFSGELATVQNMQAELATAITGANAALASIPTAEQPQPQVTANIKK